MKKVSSRNYLAGLRAHFIPVVVWLATVACLVAMFSYRARRFQVLGIAQGNVQEIAATCTGRLTSVAVELFDEVKVGQILAVIDTATDDVNQPQIVQAQLATIQAQIGELRAQLDETADRLSAEAANLETDKVNEQRRFAVNVEGAKLEVLQIEAAIEIDRLTLDRLELDGKIFVLQDRLDANDSGPYELRRIKNEYNVIAKRIYNNERLLAQAQNNRTLAVQRFERFKQREPNHPAMDKALAVIGKAITVEERRMEELLVKRVPLELKSPFKGVVSLIHRGPGETVLAGQPIMAVAETTPREIVAYVTEKQAGRVREYMTVKLVRKDSPELLAESQIIHVGPTIEQKPPRLWRNPNVPEWGRPIVIKIPSEMQLVPGETVGIREL
jgi:multidrug resistance efflux pump